MGGILSSEKECVAGGKTISVRGSIFHFVDDPNKVSPQESYEYFEDGLLLVEDGIITKIGEYEDLKNEVKSNFIDYSGRLIMPGFIDLHVHFPQVEMIASYGEQLLDWLNKYTFPTERKYKNKQYATKMAKIFLQELLRSGTTSAVVFATVHKESAEAFFEESHRLDTRMIAGKVMMDRNAPDYLLDDDAKSSYIETKELIEKWHKNGRQLYAVTPRFAPTSTPEQLLEAEKLMKEYPDVYMQTHLSENKAEIEWVKSLYPERAGYLDVYHHYGLMGSRSIFAHAIHLTDEEWQSLKETDSGLAHCPTSNFFLGSGLFHMKKAEELDIKVGIGTDVGAGTSLSQFSTLNEAYKMQQLRQYALSALKGFYLATLGGARTLELESKIGSFRVGNEADFTVLDVTGPTELQRIRLSNSEDESTPQKVLEDKLFALIMLGDDRNVVATYVMGKKLYEKV